MRGRLLFPGEVRAQGTAARWRFTRSGSTALERIKPDALKIATEAIVPVYERACRAIEAHSQPLATLNVRPTLEALRTDWSIVQKALKDYDAAYLRCSTMLDKEPNGEKGPRVSWRCAIASGPIRHRITPNPRLSAAELRCETSRSIPPRKGRDGKTGNLPQNRAQLTLETP